MSAYRDSILRDVCCPSCAQVNTAERPTTIDVDLLHNDAECSSCHYSGPLAAFLPPAASTWADKASDQPKEQR